MKMTSYTCFVAMILLLVPCSVCAFTPDGYWLMEDKETVIEFKPCGEKLCGYLVFIGENSNVKDEKNPVLEKRTRPLCNLEFIVGLTLAGERYSSGRLYDPESGETYDAYFSGNGKEIKMRVYAGAPTLGETIILTNITAGLFKRCKN